MSKVVIYLADLTHTGNGVATESMPLNIGLIASYAKKIFGNKIEICLFKYPDDLLLSLNKRRPDLLGFSNYTWNSNLSYYFTKYAKSMYPDTVTVWGGTNYPFDNINQEIFLRARPSLDIHIYYEGELSFVEIIKRLMEKNKVKNLFHSPILGCQFISPNNEFITGNIPDRIKDLDVIPSPYVSGLMDKFFDGVLSPLVETARGCPFKCNFCNAGDNYYNKVNKFSDNYVKTELTYIASKIVELGGRGGHVTFCDNNFAMIPRDSKTVDVLKGLQDSYGWPSSVVVWTGKNSKKRVIEATKALSQTLNISMSVQSMDSIVLENVNRSNIRQEDYEQIAQHLYDSGRPQHAEVIMPLPGETFNSHVQGLKDLCDTKVRFVQSHTLQMLHGTPYKDDQNFIESNQYMTKFRVVPLDFSKINNDLIFDYEEVGVATKSFSFDEYVDARVYTLIIDFFFNLDAFQYIRLYIDEHTAMKKSDILDALFIKYKNKKLSAPVSRIFDSFATETVNELFESETDLIEFYSNEENYNALVLGDIGGNVLFKHRVLMLNSCFEEWVGDVVGCIVASSYHADINNLFLNDLGRFVVSKVDNSYAKDSINDPLVLKFNFDIDKWADDLEERNVLNVDEYESDVRYEFAFSEDDIVVIEDAFKRYGADISGLIKLIQRTGSLPVRKHLRINKQDTSLFYSTSL